VLDIFFAAFWWREARNQLFRSQTALGCEVEGRRGIPGGWDFTLPK